MPRIARKDLDGKYFHIMVQGIGKECIFSNDDCKGYYLRCLENAKKFYPAKVFAFCVMSNHAHILLNVKDGVELTGFMRRANADYAGYYNRINKRVGYVFRDRYRSEVIKDERNLIYCVAYIQNNPLKAGLVKQAEDYKYSSLINYLTGRGITDISAAAKHFDASPDNMLAIMKERTNTLWLEHDDKIYEDKDKVITEILSRHKITSKQNLNNEVLIREIVAEIQDRCGISLRQIADALGIKRETLRLWSLPPSP